MIIKRKKNGNHRNKKKKTYFGQGNVAPIWPRVVFHFCAESRDVLDAFTLPDAFREVRTTPEKLVRFEQMQCGRIQRILKQHRMRRMAQQPCVPSVPIELERLRHHASANRR
jgi:hypothetical protein